MTRTKRMLINKTFTKAHFGHNDMKQLTRFLTLCLLLTGVSALTGCNEGENAASDLDVMELVEANLNNFEETWATGDGSLLGAFYAEDAVRIASNRQKPLYGRKAIADHFDLGFEQDANDPQLSLKLVAARSVGNDLILAVGEWYGTSERKGAWFNLYQTDGASVISLFDNAMMYNPTNDLSQIERVFDEEYVGEGSDILARAINRYISNLNAGNIEALAEQSFEVDGIQVTQNGILQGHEELVAGIAPPEDGVTFTAQGYGHLPVADDLVLNWGGYHAKNNEGALLAFGQWGNLNRIVDGELVLIVEAGGVYSGN